MTSFPHNNYYPQNGRYDLNRIHLVHNDYFSDDYQPVFVSARQLWQDGRKRTPIDKVFD